jgi:hypothetical protein
MSGSQKDYLDEQQRKYGSTKSPDVDKRLREIERMLEMLFLAHPRSLKYPEVKKFMERVKQ